MQKRTLIIAIVVGVLVIGGLVAAAVVVSSTASSSAPPNVNPYAPGGPPNQTPVVAQRLDNNKYQVLLSSATKAVNGGTVTWDHQYFIIYNPTTSSDPSMTVFDSSDAAKAYYRSEYIASPPNKQYSTISRSALNADYTNIAVIALQ